MIREMKLLVSFLSLLSLASFSLVAADTDLPRSTPEAQGISSAAVRSFLEAADKQIDTLHSFMLVRHGHVIAEAWWAPETADKPHVMWSLSKSFAATGVGLAAAEGKLSLDDPVLKFFPDGLFLRTEDIAKFGQLYLQKGQWKGRQLLSEKWVEAATAKQVSNDKAPSGRTADWQQGYGFQFWRCQHNAYRGDGRDGQICLVMPDQDAVIAITARTGQMQTELDLVWEILLPAFSDQALPENEEELAKLREASAGLVAHPVEKGEYASARQISPQL